MTAGGPTRIVQFTLMAALLGIALPFAILTAAEAPSPGLIAMCVGYTLQCLNFFHGKIATLEDSDYTRLLAFQPKLALFDYAANLAIVTTMVVIAVVLAEPVLVCAVNVVLRALDLVLVTRIRRVSLSTRVRRAQGSWARFDLLAIAVWAAAAAAALQLPEADRLTLVGGVFLALAVADIVMDYTYNSELYFGRSSQWDAIADLWDRIQGEHGDSYRRNVVAPALLALAGPAPLHVLDVGTGNGCLARLLAAAGHEVVGIDASERMIELARSYPADARVRFHVAAVGAAPPRAPAEVRAGPFDLVVLCFTQQDVPSLGACFRFAADRLAADGRVAVVYEDLELLQAGADHATTDRRWLSTHVPGATSRRQLVFWGTTAGAVEHATETTIYSAAAYRECAARTGLVVLRDERILPARTPDAATRRYGADPRFSLLVLGRRPAPTAGARQPG